MQKLHHIICLFVLTSFSSISSAALLDFNDYNSLGVTLSGAMNWSDNGGGHLYNDNALNDGFIVLFESETYVNSFQMNALPWPDYSKDNMVIGSIDIAAQNAANETIWQDTVDLTDYTDWNNWFTVSVETANISQLTFFAPGGEPHLNYFWPSVDNMVINQAAVPVPATAWLFASGLLGIFGLSHKRR